MYWGVDASDPYGSSTIGAPNAYLYSPVFAQIFALIGLMPQWLFVVGWTGFLAALAVWLARPWPLALLVLALPVSQEVMIGNIHLLLAAAIVLGFTWAGTWSFVLLTKVTPGVGLLWFVVRREWRPLAIVFAVTSAIFLVSYVISPRAWQDWVGLLRHDGGSQPLFLPARIVIAGAVIIWGARTDRMWTVPLGAMLALPMIWMDSFSMLLGCVAMIGFAAEHEPRRAGALKDAAVTTRVPSKRPYSAVIAADTN